MFWTLLILTIFSIIVILGVIYVMRSKLDPGLKTNILLLVGILLALALAISAFKQKRYITFSLLKTDINEVQRRFTTMDKPFKHKFKNLDSKQMTITSFYNTNYPQFDSPSSDYEERVVFSSMKYQGASMFIYNLAKKMQSKGIPCMYNKFEFYLDSQIEISEAMGIPSLRILEDAVENWNKKGLRPYIVIDGLEYVARVKPLAEVLSRMLQNHRLGFVANTEKSDCLQAFFRLVTNRDISVRTWLPPHKDDFQTVIGGRVIPKDFRMLSRLQQKSEGVKNVALKDVAAFYDCDEPLKKLMSLTNLRLSSVINEVPIDQLKKLENHGFLRISNGRVELIDSMHGFTSDYL